jgi:hypothetical protein
MKEISHLLRKAYLDTLSPLTVEGSFIPIFDELVNPNSSTGNIQGATAYVIIRDQNEVETTNSQCTFRKTASITLDIVTKYPLNRGGKLASELISNEIQQKINTFNQISFEMEGFQVLSTKLEFSRNITENGDTMTAFRKILGFSHSIYQL